MMEYQILKVLWGNEGRSSSDLACTLEQYVNEAVKEGWEPVGGIGIESWQEGVNMYQAMVKR